MRIEDAFEVPVPPEEAWRLLNDVPRVVPCMPGAELSEVVGDDAWKANVRVKLGPITLRFGADIVRESRDEASRSVLLRVKARELKGRGGAEAAIESTLGEREGGTQVTVAVDIALQGVVAQYGGGVIADVSSQLTKEFARNLAAQLDRPADAAANGTRPPSPLPPAKPVRGLRLGLVALWRAVARRFHAS